jgi:hypothetical protein
MTLVGHFTTKYHFIMWLHLVLLVLVPSYTAAAAIYLKPKSLPEHALGIIASVDQNLLAGQLIHLTAHVPLDSAGLLHNLSLADRHVTTMNHTEAQAIRDARGAATLILLYPETIPPDNKKLRELSASFYSNPDVSPLVRGIKHLIDTNPVQTLEDAGKLLFDGQFNTSVGFIRNPHEVDFYTPEIHASVTDARKDLITRRAPGLFAAAKTQSEPVEKIIQQLKPYWTPVSLNPATEFFHGWTQLMNRNLGYILFNIYAGLSDPNDLQIRIGRIAYDSKRIEVIVDINHFSPFFSIWSLLAESQLADNAAKDVFARFGPQDGEVWKLGPWEVRTVSVRWRQRRR